MPYFTRVFGTTEHIPALDSMRMLIGQWNATVRTDGDEADWEIAELVYDEEFAPVDIERYLPASDGLFEEDLNDMRRAVEQMEESEGRERVLEALHETQQIVAFRVPDDAEDTVYGPLNSAMDAIASVLGGITHADAEGFYEGQKLILPTD